MHLSHGLVLVGVVALACGGNTKASSNPSAGASSTAGGATTTEGPNAGGASTSGVSTAGDASTTEGPSAGGTGGTEGNTGSTTNGEGGFGGLLIATGGAPPTTGGSGGDSSETGGAGAGGECDESRFWRRVTQVAIGSVGSCGPAVCREGIVPLGSVVFDAEGRVSEFPEVDALLAETLMQEFDGEQWSCLADESIEFCCSAR